ncbi:MAG: hypothetical protein JWR85_3947 [Marmoricola sp.]|nr:hypothetical protein [Marmoricola sp.]
MKQIMSRTNIKIRKTVLGASGLLIAALSLGMSGTTFANSYNNDYGGYGGGNYSSYRRDDDRRENNRHYDRYSSYRYEYDRQYGRKMLYGYNRYDNRWERCDFSYGNNY